MVNLHTTISTTKNKRHAARSTLLFEPLEQRTLMSATLFITAPGGISDATHFQTLQAALTAAVTGDTLWLQSGYDATADAAGGPVSITKSIALTADAGVSLPFNLEIAAGISGVSLSHLSGGLLTLNAGSASVSVSDSSFSQVVLKGGTHNNTFTHNTIGKLTANGTDDASGHDSFQQNTFTGMVSITGNTSTATADSFLNNTFTVAIGDAVTLFRASGTLVQGNIITDSSPFASAIVVHDADDIVLLNNQITTTGMMGTGIYIFTDGSSSTSVDVSGNTIQTTDGFGLYIAKYDVTAALEVRVQSNDFHNNNVGAYVYGDGTTAGKVDFGGGTTRFGTSAGHNDFTSFTSANASHYAIGLFATDPGYALLGNNNLWGVANPLNVVADSAHTPAAFGTGIILGTQYIPATETIAATATSLSGIETGVISGIVAHFSSTASHAAADFSVTIAWGDGTTSAGIVVANAGGGFDVMASHAWDEAANYTFTVSVSVANASASATAQGSAAINSRVIAVTGTNITSSTKSPFNGIVAGFTDNLPGNISAYIASVAWSDGQTTAATIIKNADGSFSIKTNRSFSKAGVVLASVSIGTADGLFFGTTSLTASITDNNGKCPGRDYRPFRQLICILKHNIKCHSYSHGRPAFANVHCRR